MALHPPLNLGGTPTLIVATNRRGTGYQRKSWDCLSKSQTDTEITKMMFLPEGVLQLNQIRKLESTISKIFATCFLASLMNFC